MNDHQLTYISIDSIIPSAHQPRATFAEKALVELADSIRVHGILEPLLVISTGTHYQVIAGERRYRAAKLAGLTKLPVIILRGTRRELMEIAIIENLQRQNLNPIEEAQAIQALMETHGLTHEEVARTLGRSRPAITNLLRILALPLDVQLLIQQGKLSQGHARALLAIKAPRQIIVMANLCIEKKWSVHALTQEIEALNAKPISRKKPQPPRRGIEFQSLIDQMERTFQMPIKVKGDEHRGSLTLHYGSMEDLQRIYELLGKLNPPDNE